MKLSNKELFKVIGGSNTFSNFLKYLRIRIKYFIARNRMQVRYSI